MTRGTFLERNLIQIYGQQPSDDAVINYNLLNVWLSDAVAIAAKTNYKENIQVEGVDYVNNGFYTTFKGLTISQDENFLWKFTLPEIPLGLGASKGISTVQAKDKNNNISLPWIPLSEDQKGYFQGMRPVPNKILYYQEGIFCYAISTLQLWQYTASVSMVSGGDSTNLDSVLNCPPDYFPVMVDYLMKQLAFEQSRPLDNSNDGVDDPSTKRA
jgi:hypothetical protein